MILSTSGASLTDAAAARDDVTTDPAECVELLRAAERIDPLPMSVVRLAGLIGESSVEIARVVEVVGCDQSLTANLLRQANSAAGGARVPIRTVRDAVVRLGTASVFTLALGSSVRGAMTAAIPAFDLREGDLWRHSVTASLAAEVLRSATPLEVGPEASVAALLADFGKAVIAVHFGGLLMEACVGSSDSSVDPLAAETMVFGFTHADVGALVARRWNLPSSVSDAIACHHRVGHCAQLSPLGRVVGLAHVVVDAVEGAPQGSAVPGDWLASLHIHPGRYDDIVCDTSARLGELAVRYGVN